MLLILDSQYAVAYYKPCAIIFIVTQWTKYTMRQGKTVLLKMNSIIDPADAPLSFEPTMGWTT